MENKKHVIDFLKSHSISFEEYNHPALFTVEQANEREDTIPGVHTKNLFIRDKRWGFAMITLLAHKKLDGKVFRAQSGIKEFSFGNPEQLWNELKVTPGSVGIFGLLNNTKLTLYLDKEIWNANQFGRHPNDNTITLVINKEGLVKYIELLDIDLKIIAI